MKLAYLLVAARLLVEKLRELRPRRLAALGLVRVTRRLARVLDSAVVDVHAVITEPWGHPRRPGGGLWPLPVTIDACVPKGQALIVSAGRPPMTFALGDPEPEQS